MTAKTKNPSKVNKTQSTLFRSAYSPPVRYSFTTTDSRTEQSHKEECDINQILSKYIKTGVLAHQKQYAPQYGDYSSTDFHEAQNIIATAMSMFQELPSKVRNHFENDPAKFLDFASDENNNEAMAMMGLTDHMPTEAKHIADAAPEEAANAKADENQRDKTVAT